MRQETEHQAVRVAAPARLHLGFVDLNGERGRKFGSIGLALDAPATVVTARRARSDRFSGVEAARTRTTLERLRGPLGLSGSYDIAVERAIPAHAGLGSGTQIALAVAGATLALDGRTMSAEDIARFTDRGRRSAIGIAAFTDGGFIVDGGRGRLDRPPPVLIRAPFPEEWRVLLILDAQATGVHGDRETEAFATLPSMLIVTAEHLSHLVLMQAAPALVEHDIVAFGAAIGEIQRLVGSHFSAAQGGSAWSSPRVGALARRLAAAGAHGIGQSSWGPTGFAFAPTQSDALNLYQSFVEDAKAQGLELMIASGRNSGAHIEAVTPAHPGQ
ncbi:MAG: beta-ribofuranosylaminobenzene 5'-phosphate synthase family protein [Hyphomicrobiaceae bacterium]